MQPFYMMYTAFAGLQVTVVFLVDAEKCLPSKDDWPKVWAVQQAWIQGKKDHDNQQVVFARKMHHAGFASGAASVLTHLTRKVTAVNDSS